MTVEFLKISIRILIRNFRVENAAVKLILGHCAIYHAVDIGIPKIKFYEFCV